MLRIAVFVFKILKLTSYSLITIHRSDDYIIRIDASTITK